MAKHERHVYHSDTSGKFISKEETARLRDESRRGIERMRETTRKTEEVFKRVTNKG